MTWVYKMTSLFRRLLLLMTNRHLLCRYYYQACDWLVITSSLQHMVNTTLMNKINKGKDCVKERLVKTNYFAFILF